MQEIQAVLAKAGGPQAVAVLVEMFVALLPAAQDEAAAEIMRALKFPNVADQTARLVALLDERVGSEAFDGDLWAAVAWAEAQGIDVRSPPERPGAPGED